LNFCKNSSFSSGLAPKERSGLGAIANKTLEFKEIEISLDFLFRFVSRQNEKNTKET